MDCKNCKNYEPAGILDAISDAWNSFVSINVDDPNIIMLPYPKYKEFSDMVIVPQYRLGWRNMKFRGAIVYGYAGDQIVCAIARKEGKK